MLAVKSLTSVAFPIIYLLLYEWCFNARDFLRVEIFKKWLLKFTLLFYGCYTSTTHNDDDNRLHLKQ